MNRGAFQRWPSRPIDFYAELYPTLFQDARFQAWKDLTRRWQLHLSGGPGSGKTTLSLRIIEYLLRESPLPSTLIQIQESVHSEEPVLTVYKSKNDHDVVQSSGTLDSRALYGDLDYRIILHSPGYLVIDGFDKLSVQAQTDTLRALELPETQGLRVLLLRNVPELVLYDPLCYICNVCRSGAQEEEEKLQLYWTCNICDHQICNPCKLLGNHCSSSEHRMFEPYKVIHIALRSIPSRTQDFARLDLTAEFGSAPQEDIIEAVSRPAEGNINLTKLRLDYVRNLEAIHAVQSVHDRLPREIVTYFNSIIRSISPHDAVQRYQTLIALAAVAEGRKMSINQLENILSFTGEYDTQGHQHPDYPIVDRVLRSATGLLCTVIDTGKVESEPDRQKVTLYVDDLYWYIRDNYNEDLALAREYLRAAVKEGATLDRSHEFHQILQPRRKSAAGAGLSRPSPAHSSAVDVACQIMRDPGLICNFCQRTLFDGHQNSGTLICGNTQSDATCPICQRLYAMLMRAKDPSAPFHWSRRTMGHIFDSTMSITLQVKSQTGAKVERTLLFITKSEVGLSPDAAPLSQGTDLEHTGDRIQSWLHTCLSEHPHCLRAAEPAYVPKRLIDLQTGSKGQYRVVFGESKDPGPYVTLSHSWGKAPKFLTLTTKNQQDLMSEGFRSVDLENKNFEEAIEVAQFLDVRYVWIDSLCICQEGKDKDFTQEGQYMHLVYQNSFCNIVAADSKDGNGGLFRERQPLAESSVGAGSWMMLDKNFWADELLQSPIYTRGWVFQERMLSPRILHFAKSQVFWDCSAMSACETLPNGIPFAASAPATTDRRWRRRLQRRNSDKDTAFTVVEDSLESFWKTAVLNYTSCELTNQHDKTLAIWSVAKLVRDQLELEDQYGGGLWAKVLHEQLAWQVKVTRKEARLDTLQSKFPSWSWASVNAPIQIRDRLVETRCYTVKSHQESPIAFGDFVDKATKRDHQPEFAASNSLTICGYLVAGNLAQTGTAERYRFGCATTTASKQGNNSLTLILDEEPTPALLALRDFYLLPLVTKKNNEEASTYSGTGLVLVTNNDFHQLTQSKLCKRIIELASLYRPHVRRHKDKADRDWEMRTLCGCIQALNSWMYQVAKWDQDTPARVNMVYRRIGVVEFNDLPAGVWDEFRSTGEQCFWLD